MTAETSNAREPDVAMALHWIDRYAAGIDDECQIDLVAEALGVTLPDGYGLSQQPEARGVVDGWRLVIRYGEYDDGPGVWAEKGDSLVWIAALTGERNG